MMNQTNPNKINYGKVLSAVAHDMKNSLTMMFQSLQTLGNQPEEQKHITASQLADINYQVQRLNGGLTQIMGLYQAEGNRLVIHSQEVLISDLLESVICQNDLYTESTGIDCELDVDEDLLWYLDTELISYLIDDVLSNAIRYSKNKIIIKAAIIEQQLQISVTDDSAGYPQQMLDAAAAPIEQLDSEFGRMGIGLLFSRLIAISHQNNVQYGKIFLTNNSKLGGSEFMIRLP